MAAISHERAERIARAHACENCGEYSYKKLRVRAATKEQRESLNMTWHAVKVCGVCGLEQEIGIDDEGDIVYAA